MIGNIELASYGNMRYNHVHVLYALTRYVDFTRFSVVGVFAVACWLLAPDLAHTMHALRLAVRSETVFSAKARTARLLLLGACVVAHLAGVDVAVDVVLKSHKTC